MVAYGTETFAARDFVRTGIVLTVLAELMWNPDALLFNPRLDWRVVDARVLAVRTGEDARRSEVRPILNEDGDLVRVEADDRPRQDGRYPPYAHGSAVEAITR
jgi:hypothetical protein